MRKITVRNVHTGATFVEKIATERLDARLAWHAGRSATEVVSVDDRPAGRN